MAPAKELATVIKTVFKDRATGQQYAVPMSEILPLDEPFPLRHLYSVPEVPEEITEIPPPPRGKTRWPWKLADTMCRVFRRRGYKHDFE